MKNFEVHVYKIHTFGEMKIIASHNNPVENRSLFMLLFQKQIKGEFNKSIFSLSLELALTIRPTIP